MIVALIVAAVIVLIAVALIAWWAVVLAWERHRESTLTVSSAMGFAAGQHLVMNGMTNQARKGQWRIVALIDQQSVRVRPVSQWRPW